MDNTMKARTYYAAAVSLFQDPSPEDCEIAIELLEKSLNLYSDLDVRVFTGDVWHYLLKSLDPNNDLETYEKYKKSPAWHRKRDLVRERDKSLCICGVQATEVHHKNYHNIGKEPLSDLVALCKECHERLHQPYVPSNPQPCTQPAPCVPSNDPPGKVYWDKFKSYVEENQLHLFPDPDLPSIYGIQIDRKTLNSGDISEDGAFWLIAFRSANELQANLCMQSPTHYSHLKNQRDIIEGQFEDNLAELKWQDDRRWVGFSDNTVGNVSRANTDREFPWLHDRLVRLHAVFQPLVLELQEGNISVSNKNIS